MCEHKRIWTVFCKKDGLKYVILIEATEENLHNYMNTEIPDAVSYSGTGEEEVSAAKMLRMPIYMA